MNFKLKINLKRDHTKFRSIKWAHLQPSPISWDYPFKGLLLDFLLFQGGMDFVNPKDHLIDVRLCIPTLGAVRSVVHWQASLELFQASIMHKRNVNTLQCCLNWNHGNCFRAAILGQLMEGENPGFFIRPGSLSLSLIFLFMNTVNPVKFYPRNPGLILDFEIHGTPWILPWFFTILY
jgi:hypothetical protein